MQDSINKLQEDSYNLVKKLELMKYAIAGFIEENSDAYFFQDFCNDILLIFSKIIKTTTVYCLNNPLRNFDFLGFNSIFNRSKRFIVW